MPETEALPGSPDPVTVELQRRFNQMFQPDYKMTKEDHILCDFVVANPFAEMPEEKFNQLYAMLFGEDA